MQIYFTSCANNSDHNCICFVTSAVYSEKLSLGTYTWESAREKNKETGEIASEIEKKKKVNIHDSQRWPREILEISLFIGFIIMDKVLVLE